MQKEARTAFRWERQIADGRKMKEDMGEDGMRCVPARTFGRRALRVLIYTVKRSGHHKNGTNQCDHLLLRSCHHFVSLRLGCETYNTLCE